MSVIIRKVRTAIQREYQKAGGIRIQEAIEQAQENLGGLAEECLEQIDLAMQVIEALTDDPERGFTDAELLRMHGLVNGMLGCCAAVDIPGLADTLYAVGRLLGSLMATEHRPAGALTPAVNLMRLVRRGAVSPADLRVLIAAIDQCAKRISAQPRAASRVGAAP